jgi:hypothetical protein
MTLHPYGHAGLDLTDTTPRTHELEALVTEVDAELAERAKALTQYPPPAQYGYQYGVYHGMARMSARLRALLAGSAP